MQPQDGEKMWNENTYLCFPWFIKGYWHIRKSYHKQAVLWLFTDRKVFLKNDMLQGFMLFNAVYNSQ